MTEHEARAREIAEKLTKPQQRACALLAVGRAYRSSRTVAKSRYREVNHRSADNLILQGLAAEYGFSMVILTPLGRLVAAEIARMEARET